MFVFLEMIHIHRDTPLKSDFFKYAVKKKLFINSLSSNGTLGSMRTYLLSQPSILYPIFIVYEMLGKSDSSPDPLNSQ